MQDKRNTLIKLKLKWILQNIKVVNEYGYQSNLYPMPIKTDLSEQQLWEFLRGFFPVMERVLKKPPLNFIPPKHLQLCLQSKDTQIL